jgi:hypothetical protein
VSVAAVVCLISWANSPAPPDRAARSELASLSDLTDVGEANSLKIVQYDEDLARLDTFTVAQQRGRWVIPSHDNYPADAEEQLRNIARIFVDLKSIVQVSEDSKVHEQFGVIEPGEELTAGSRGVGRLVTISDKKDQPLVNLIIGNRAEATEESDTLSATEEYRFVRVVGQPAVHVAKISLESLTPKFEQWIERDLLKMNVFDVQRLALNDYSILVGEQNGALVASRIQRMDSVLKLVENNQWSLESMKIYENNRPVDSPLAEDEELNKTRIDDVKTALDELKIIDVDRKPAVLAKALQDDKLAQSREAMVELQRYGFFVTRAPGGQPDIFGSNGSLQLALKDGVTYRLIFGRDKGADKDDAAKLNRYLMVRAEVDKSLIPEPELEAELPAPAGPAEPKAESPPTDSAAAKEPAAEKTAAEKSDSSGDEPATKEPASKEAAKEEPAAKEDADKTEEEIRAEELAKKERERIKRDNQRKKDEYADKVNKAQQRVNELNARFDDWFYVVADDVYKKVQLSRADLVKDSGAAKDGGFGPDAFRRLQREGIRPKPKATSAPNPPGFPGGN